MIAHRAGVSREHSRSYDSAYSMAAIREPEVGREDDSETAGPTSSYFAEPVDRRDVEGVGILSRLYATPGFHRFLPAAVALPIARFRGYVNWRFSRSHRRRAVDWAKSVIGPDAEPRHIRRLARPALGAFRTSEELQWRPWLLKRAGVRNPERLGEATPPGMGAVIVTTHMGGYAALTALLLALRRQGREVVFPRATGPRHAHQFRGYSGLVKLEFFSQLDAANIWSPGRGGSFEEVADQLREGALVMIHSDVIGSMSVTLLGQPARIVSGPAELAKATGAPIVPCVVRRRLWRFTVEVNEPIDPRSFPEPAALSSAMVAALEPELRERIHTWYPHPFPSREWQRKARIKRISKLAAQREKEQRVIAARRRKQRQARGRKAERKATRPE
jgi:lauroyl/myristoyl acyltransferase